MKRAIVVGILALLGAAGTGGAHLWAGAPQAQAAPPAAASVVSAVRTALGRGNPDDAKRAVQASRDSAARKSVASALIAIYEGKDDDAKRTLTPLVSGESADDDAMLELGLLELRHGRKDAATDLLTRATQSSKDLDTDGFLLMARASAATGDVTVANSIFQRIGPAEPDRADVQAAWGDLWLQTHSDAEAARSYQDALKADPAWVPALIGAARALRGADGAVSDQLLTKAQQIAPKSPDVWLFTAETQMDVEDFAAARASLDKAAALRPNWVPELAARASVIFARGTAADVEPIIAQAKAINPASTEVLRAVAAQAAQLYRNDEAAAFAKRAVAADPSVAGPHADLGAYLLRTGDEAQARTELEAAFKIDPYDTVTFNLLQMLDGLEKFTVIKDGDLVFKFTPEDAAVLSPYAIPLGQAAYKEYVSRYGFTPQGPIYIEIFDQHDSFAVRTIGLPGIVGALGACFGRVIAMDSPKARPPGDFSWQATLWHEMAHVFTLQLSKYRVPRWLTEGLSQYEEHRRSAPWGRELTMQYASLMAQGRTFSIKQLSETFKTHQIAMGYFEASLVAEHLEQLGGTTALRTLLAAYADGADDTQAMTKAFGKTVPEIETSFKAFAEERFGALRDALKDPAVAAGARAGQSAKIADDDLPALRARAEAQPKHYPSQMAVASELVRTQQGAAAKPFLQRAAALAPPAGGEDGPFALLATIAIQTGDKAEARKNLRHLLDYNHDNIAAARTLATLALEANAGDEIDFALTRIADLDPFDGEAHTQLGRRQIAKGNADRALIEFKAALALGPANMADARTDLGEAYLKLGRKDEAKKEAFAALELAPTFARAQDLLLAALGKEVE